MVATGTGGNGNAATGGAAGSGGDNSGGGNSGGGDGSGGDSSGAGGDSASGSGGTDSTGAGGSGGASVCATGTADYCTELYEFTAATQVVDGVGDEFCDIPPMSGQVATLPFIHADYSDTSLPATYVLRAGWSQDAFHAHVSVTDPSVHTDATGELWRGDTVQLYIAPSATLSGTFGTDEDGSARHILLSPPDADNPSGRAVFLASNAQYSDVSPENYAARLTADGYEVEVRLLWANNAEPRESGAQFAFDFSMSVIDTEGVELPELEGWLSHNPIPDTCDHPWCDDRAWCQPLLQ